MDLISYKNEGLSYLNELANRKTEGSTLNKNLKEKLEFFKQTIQKYQNSIFDNNSKVQKVNEKGEGERGG